MVDSIYRTRSLGVPTEGIPDQYSDGKAAKVWEFYIGQKERRAEAYCQWLVELLRDRGCKTVLDVACGTGVDSIMLLEQGFEVYSVDASDKMLKYALKERWNRRKEAPFDKWVIEEANWLTLPDDIHKPNDIGYDAVLCLGNSFAHLPDFEGTGEKQKLAIRNFEQMVHPRGGLLLIDHRNYDAILDTGHAPTSNIYYSSANLQDIDTSILIQNGQAKMITLDYIMDMSAFIAAQPTPGADTLIQGMLKKKAYDGPPVNHFRLSYYPHRLERFSAMLRDAFGQDRCRHQVYGDFQPLDPDPDKPSAGAGGEPKPPPAFYIHVVEKVPPAEGTE